MKRNMHLWVLSVFFFIMQSICIYSLWISHLLWLSVLFFFSRATVNWFTCGRLDCVYLLLSLNSSISCLCAGGFPVFVTHITTPIENNVLTYSHRDSNADSSGVMNNFDVISISHIPEHKCRKYGHLVIYLHINKI